LFDVGIKQITRRHILEPLLRRGWRNITRRVQGANDKSCHLIAQDTSRRTVIAAATAEGDLADGHLLDKGIEGVRRRHIRKALRRRRWRVEIAKRADDEGSHLLASNHSIRAVIAPATSQCDATRRELADS